MQANFRKKVQKKNSLIGKIPTKLFDIMFISFCIPLKSNKIIPLKSNKINGFPRVVLYSYKNK